MKNKFIISLSLASMLLLSACGSGSGDSSSPSDNKNSEEVDKTTNDVNLKLLNSYNYEVGANGVEGIIGVDVVGNSAYAVGTFGLSILDIGNPASIKELGSYSSGYLYSDITVVGDFAYAKSHETSDKLNLSDINNISLEPFSHIYYSSDTPANDTTFFVKWANNGFVAHNINDSSLSYEYFPGLSIGVVKDIALEGDYLYMAHTASGFDVINISDLNNMSNVKSYYQTDDIRKLIVKDSYVYAIDTAGIKVIDASVGNGHKLEVAASYEITNITDWKISGNLLFVSQRESLKIFNISDKTSLKLVATYEISSYSSFDVAGNYIYLTNSKNSYSADERYSRLDIIDIYSNN